MTTHPLSGAAVPSDSTLRQVLESIDRTGLAVALLSEPDGTLAGLLTDGDVRRAILAGAGLADPAHKFATSDPQTVPAGSGRALVLDVMRALRISAIPEVDDRGCVVGLHTLSDVIGPRSLEIPAVVMAGGRGSRLGELTRTTAKPLLEVAGRTVLEWIVLNLVGGGVRDITVSVNHLAEQLEAHLGDGGRLGCSVDYLHEDRPLGTAGALALFRAARPEQHSPTLVMNGDLMVQFDPASMLAAHRHAGAVITVATRAYQHNVPFGVIDYADDRTTVRSIAEKPVVSMDVNAGIYLLEPLVLDMLEPGVATTMPELIQRALDQGALVHSWALGAEWIDIGTPADLDRARRPG